MQVFARDMAGHASELTELSNLLTQYQVTLKQARATVSEGILMLALSTNQVSKAQALARDELGEISGGSVDESRVHSVLMVEAQKLLS